MESLPSSSEHFLCKLSMGWCQPPSEVGDTERTRPISQMERLSPHGGYRIFLRSKTTETSLNQTPTCFHQHPLHLFLSEVISPAGFRRSWLRVSIKELDLALFGFPVLFLTALFNGQTVCFIYLIGFLHIVSGSQPSPADHITACAGLGPSVGFTLNQILIVTAVINREAAGGARSQVIDLVPRGSGFIQPGLHGRPFPIQLRLHSGTKAESPLNNVNLIADVFMK